MLASSGVAGSPAASPDLCAAVSALSAFLAQGQVILAACEAQLNEVDRARLAAGPLQPTPPKAVPPMGTGGRNASTSLVPERTRSSGIGGSESTAALSFAHMREQVRKSRPE